MRRTFILMLVLGLFLSWSLFYAEDGFYVMAGKKKNFVAVEKSGVTNCYDTGGTVIGCSGTGQDGEYQKGITWPNPRFTDNQDGTVTDNLTGLIWLKDANCFGKKTWADALNNCNTLSNGLSCGLSDGSVQGDWRLPNIKELLSLIDFGNSFPPLPSGHPFSNVQPCPYWSGSSYASFPSFAWLVRMSTGRVPNGAKSTYYYVWPVRGGN